MNTKTTKTWIAAAALSLLSAGAFAAEAPAVEAGVKAEATTEASAPAAPKKAHHKHHHHKKAAKKAEAAPAAEPVAK